MAIQLSTVHGQKTASQMAAAKPLVIGEKDVAAAYKHLNRVGVNIGQTELRTMMRQMAVDVQDAADGFTAPLIAQSAPSITTPVQFLQTWLPGLVRKITAARKIDILTGVTTVGNFEDEEVIQGNIELLNHPEPYTDYGNIPLASWGNGYERRSIVRFEQGFEVGFLESARTSRAQIDTAAEKRASVAEGLEVERNKVGFYGYNGGANRTYGFLNDPALLAATTVPVGASGGTAWSSKTFKEITADLRVAAAAMQNNSQDTIDPEKAQIVLVLPTQVRQFLTTVTDFGISVMGWLKETYPNWRIESAPQLNNAVGGVNVMYLYAESLEDGSTDGGQTWIQIVPAKFITIGTEKRAKAYLEVAGNALGGVMLKRPYAVLRYLGI